MDARDAIPHWVSGAETVLCVLPGGRKIISRCDTWIPREHGCVPPKISWIFGETDHVLFTGDRPTLVLRSSVPLWGSTIVTGLVWVPSSLFSETRLLCRAPLSLCTQRPLANLPALPVGQSTC